MSSTSNTISPLLPTAETSLTADELLSVVTAQRRRRVLLALNRRGGRTSFDTLASALEATGDSSDSTAALYHLALPKLERADLVVCDGDDIALTESGSSVAAWLDLVVPR